MSRHRGLPSIVSIYRLRSGVPVRGTLLQEGADTLTLVTSPKGVVIQASLELVVSTEVISYPSHVSVTSRCFCITCELEMVVRCLHRHTASLANDKATGLIPAILDAVSRTLERTVPGSKMPASRPAALASAAGMGVPNKIICIACTHSPLSVKPSDDIYYMDEGSVQAYGNVVRWGRHTLYFPMALVSLCVPPAPGSKPMLTSGSPKRLLDDANMRSHWQRWHLSIILSSHRTTLPKCIMGTQTYHESNFESSTQLWQPEGSNFVDSCTGST